MKTLLALIVFSISSVASANLPVLITNIDQAPVLENRPRAYSTVRVKVAFCANVSAEDFELEIGRSNDSQSITVNYKAGYDCMGLARVQTVALKTNKLEPYLPTYVLNPVLVGHKY